MSNPFYLKSRCPNCKSLSTHFVESDILVGSKDFVKSNQSTFYCGVCENFYSPYNSIAHEVLNAVKDFLDDPKSKAKLTVLKNCYNFHKGITE